MIPSTPNAGLVSALPSSPTPPCSTPSYRATASTVFVSSPTPSPPTPSSSAPPASRVDGAGRRLTFTTGALDDDVWVLAAPFRAWVHHLMSAAQVPWQAVAHRAGLPLATVSTLLFGRDGKPRAKVSHQAAQVIIALKPRDLTWMRLSQVSAENVSTRIRLLRGRGVSWDQIASMVYLNVAEVQSLARGERTCCSALVDILIQSACESASVQIA